MVKVIWTEIAIDDLRSIHDYISKDSILYADRFVDKIINRVSQLENFPKSGRVVPEFDSPLIRELI
jgi:toxin ParE1/3/4